MPPRPDDSPGPSSPGLAWYAFLAACFVVVGLTGLFVTFGAPLTLERQAAREEALDAAVRATRGPDPLAALSRLRPALDDSAAAVMPTLTQSIDLADIEARIARERTDMRARFALENTATLVRLRWLVCLITLMSAGFGVVVMRLASRAA